jgi:hypothetical protein
MHLLCASLLVQTWGCGLLGPERAAPAGKSSPADARGITSTPTAPAPSTAPAQAEQLDKSRQAEKKAIIPKDKKAATATDKSSTRKTAPQEAPHQDPMAPPAPLKPPTFGGAGG